jgi:hypothetical protein
MTNQNQMLTKSLYQKVCESHILYKVFQKLSPSLIAKGLTKDHILRMDIFNEIQMDIETACFNSQIFGGTDPRLVKTITSVIVEKYYYLNSAKTEFYARVCDITGEPMNEGFYHHSDACIKNAESLLNLLPKTSSMSDAEIMSSAYSEGLYYWTEWEDVEDISYAVIDGLTYKID